MPGWFKEYVASTHKGCNFCPEKSKRCLELFQRGLCIDLVFATVDRAITGRPSWGQKDLGHNFWRLEPLGFSALHKECIDQTLLNLHYLHATSRQESPKSVCHLLENYIGLLNLDWRFIRQVMILLKKNNYFEYLLKGREAFIYSFVTGIEWLIGCFRLNSYAKGSWTLWPWSSKWEGQWMENY